MKKLTFLVPAYNALFWLEKNEKFWKSLSEFAEIVLVEDSCEEQMKGFCSKLNIRYFSKRNGNWGSVINFAIEQKLINTEWIAILDADDTVKIGELKKLLKHLENTDVVFTKSDFIDYKTKKVIKRTSEKWIHSTWMKTSFFYSIPNLPEDVFFMDQFVMAYVLNSKNQKSVNDLQPYNYFVNIPGQSVDVSTFDILISKMQSYLVMQNEFPKWIETNEIYVSKKEVTANSFVIAGKIRYIYDNTSSRSELRKLRNLYSDLYKGKSVPFRKKIFWSMLYRFFVFKWLKLK